MPRSGSVRVVPRTLPPDIPQMKSIHWRTVSVTQGLREATRVTIVYNARIIFTKIRMVLGVVPSALMVDIVREGAQCVMGVHLDRFYYLYQTRKFTVGETVYADLVTVRSDLMCGTVQTRSILWTGMGYGATYARLDTGNSKEFVTSAPRGRRLEWRGL